MKLTNEFKMNSNKKKHPYSTNENSKLKKKLKNSTGITLISLVTTIVVLLILAGIVISILLKGNIIDEAITAGELTRKQEATDIINLKITNLQMKNYVEEQQLPTLQKLANGLCDDNDIEYVNKMSHKTASLTYIDVSDVSSIFTKLKEYPYEFEIDQSLRLASIDGVEIANSGVQPGASEDYNKLVAQLNELQNKVNTLEAEKASTNAKLSNLETKLNALEESAEYQPGDSITISACTLPGILTTTGKSLQFSIHLGKNISKSVQSVELSSNYFGVRAEGKYLLGSSYGSYNVGDFFKVACVDGNIIYFEHLSTTAFPATNNIPVALTATNLTIHFK